MTHRDASRTRPTRGKADRAAPGTRRPAPADTARGGFTESELALIHATAEANNTFICIECSVVPDGTFPPTSDGALRPEVARILASLRKDAPAPRPARSGTLADRTTARSADQPGAAADRLAARADATAAPRAVNGVAYDRDAYDLQASRHLAAAGDQVDVTEVGDVVLADVLEDGRG